MSIWLIGMSRFSPARLEALKCISFRLPNECRWEARLSSISSLWTLWRILAYSRICCWSVDFHCWRSPVYVGVLLCFDWPVINDQVSFWSTSHNVRLTTLLGHRGKIHPMLSPSFLRWQNAQTKPISQSDGHYAPCHSWAESLSADSSGGWIQLMKILFPSTIHHHRMLSLVIHRRRYQRPVLSE